MNVADEGQKIGIFLAEDRLISIFEEMTRSMVPAIVVLGIPRKEPSHDRRDACLAAPK